MSTKEHILHITNLCVRYPRNPETYAVDLVSLSIKKETTFGLVGESGSGKSSLARAVMGLVAADTGSIWFRNQDLTTLKPAEFRQLRSHIQMIFQDPYAALSPRKNIFASLTEPLESLAEMNTLETQDRIHECLHMVGLDGNVLNRYPHQFSGGQLQRICIARALLLEPELVIADEPVSSLDVSIQAQILNLLKDLQKRLGISMIFISHDLTVVRHMADDVGVMYQGQLVEKAPCEELFAQPQQPYTRSLLAAIPDIEYV